MRVLIPRQMGRWLVGGLFAATLSATCVTSWAQAGAQDASSVAPATKPASSASRPEDLEPGVNTSAMPATTSEPPPAPPTAPVATSKSVATRGQTTVPQAAGSVATDRTSAAGMAGATNKTSAASRSGQKAQTPGSPPSTVGSVTTATAATPKAGATGGKSQDRIELDTTQITGNRELPKVLYIVPWKRSDLGDLMGKPVNSLIDEVLTPVDRDVFKRENRYYDALKPDGAKQAAGAAAGSGDKH